MSASFSTAKLAVSGGQAIRKTWLPYGKQSIDESDIKAVTDVLRSDWITRGPTVERFERAVAEFVEMPHGIAFTSATAALHAVMAMHDVKSKGLITTPNTFAATTNAALYCGGSVQFSDVEDSTLNLDPARLSVHFDIPRKAIVTSVDFAGNPCRYKELNQLQKKYDFVLVDDASHSLGAKYFGRPVGSQADQSIFSFHPVKSMTTGEGGMVVTRDPAEAEFLRHFRTHGMIRTDQPGLYWIEFLGYNYNMTDLQCALGISQLKRLPQFVKRRAEIANAYHQYFSRFGEELQLIQTTEGCESSWHLYPVRLKLSKLKVNRDEFLKALHGENIGANVHYIPVYWHPLYERQGFQRGLCPVYEEAYWQELSLPIFPDMTDVDVQDVCLAMEKCLEAFRK